MSENNQYHIGIVEDNIDIRKNVMKYLGYDQAFKCEYVYGSVESLLHDLKKNSKLRLDALLLDIGLPGLSGLEGIPLIKEALPDVEIIMLTTYEEEDKILKALCSGATSYLSKKSSLSEIASAIKIVLNGGSYMSPSIAREIVQHLMGGRKSKATILTDRQKEILEELSNGSSYSTVAKKLFISVETVRSHVKKMYKTLQVNNKTEAISMYMSGQIG